jgi:hypothetical protein
MDSFYPEVSLRTRVCRNSCWLFTRLLSFRNVDRSTALRADKVEQMDAFIKPQPPTTFLGQWLLFILINSRLIKAAELVLTFIACRNELASCKRLETV